MQKTSGMVAAFIVIIILICIFAKAGSTPTHYDPYFTTSPYRYSSNRAATTTKRYTTTTKSYYNYTPKYRTTKKRPSDYDPYNAKSYSNEEDFYFDHYDDFFDYYDAEDYYNDHH
ncbi:MAG: hypothetical protein IJS17_02020 [Clostridia bacterium]|nr:hypothetical protein [Clostridia bacterium]